VKPAPAVSIGKRQVGPGHPAYIIAEIGINHNGSLETAKKLIDAAAETGCDAVKFQKRTVDVVYTAAELAKPRDNPFGATNGHLKRGLEFGLDEYREIDAYCRSKGLDWFASCWDEQSVDFIEQFNPVCYKIASASLTDDNLLRYYRKFGRPIILSTGMSDMQMIDHAISVLGREDLILLHCTSTYPSAPSELNLRGITVALGACVVERHITLDRSMWGSDQSASIEPQGWQRLVRDVRTIEEALGDGEIKIYESERPIIQKLRRVS
jgi:N-acetylneuraminate synthase